jgi:hypothetical protein
MSSPIPEAFERLRLGYSPLLAMLTIGDEVPMLFQTDDDDPLIVEGRYRVVGQDGVGYELEYVGEVPRG